MGIDLATPKHEYYDSFIHNNINSEQAAINIAEFNPEVIFHLAASADVTDSTKRPALYYKNNIGATAALIDNLLTKDWSGPIIFSSTAAVYGVQDTPCKEDINIDPPNSYGMSKLMCETFLNNVHQAHGISIATFRYFNVAGAYEDVGDHIDSNHVIQKLCYSATNNQPFFMFGYDLDTRDGSCIRDYLHVRDVSRAHFHVLDFITNYPGSYTFNLGTKQGVTVKELATSFIERTGKNVHIVPSKSRPGDPSQLVADPSLFIEQTGFKYKHSDIDNIINSAWDWYRRNDAV